MFVSEKRPAQKKNLTYCVPATGFAWASGKATISRELLLQQCLSTPRIRKVLTFLSFPQLVFDKVSLLWKSFSFEFSYLFFSILAQRKRTYYPPPSLLIPSVPCFTLRLIFWGWDILSFANEAVIFFLFFGVSARIGGV